MTDATEAGLSGRTAIVTGAARGIGHAIAQRLADDGAKVMLADIDADTLASAAAGMDSMTMGAIDYCAGDLSLEETASTLLSKTMDLWGRVDILVNNAGGGVIRPFLEHTAETLKTTIDRNLWTTIWCCRAALPVMVEQGYGRIINIGADSVRNGIWAHAAYNGAKGGVHGMTTGLAREFADTDITVNTVAPCVVSTPEVDALIEKGIPRMQKFVDVVPKGRPARMEEVASTVAYLARAEASFITGQVISVNGGSTML